MKGPTKPSAVGFQDGFTLLEVLVGMTLLAFLSVALFQAFDIGAKSWAKAEGATSGADQIMAGEKLLADALDRSYPLVIQADATRLDIAFDGHPNELEFLAPDDSRPGMLLQMRLAVEQRKGRKALVLFTKPELDRSSGSGWKRLLLLSDISELQLAYFGASGEQSPNWHSDWSNAPVLPRLVRVRIGFPDPSHPAWPELIVAPHISADVSCNFDLLLKGCAGQ
jgi:general secretion pathway protein J